jgi:hypothetical protein
MRCGIHLSPPRGLPSKQRSKCFDDGPGRIQFSTTSGTFPLFTSCCTLPFSRSYSIVPYGCAREQTIGRCRKRPGGGTQSGTQTLNWKQMRVTHRTGIELETNEGDVLSIFIYARAAPCNDSCGATLVPSGAVPQSFRWSDAVRIDPLRRWLPAAACRITGVYSPRYNITMCWAFPKTILL